MRLSPILVPTLVSLLTSRASAEQTVPRSAIVYAWPLSAPSPTPLLAVTYDPERLTASASDYSPPSPWPPASSPSDDLMRVGLYDASAKKWTGVLTSSASFSPTAAKTLTLHLDAGGAVQHVGFHASEPSRGERDDERPRVLLVKPSPGPSPHVNRPVLVDADGKAPEKPEERSLLQKYWWVLLGVLMLAMVGSGDK
ncbi:MAG: hypothetical protein M1832_000699 [Thelocarpon impressellum]|nr:MAG: hypothetical protein M1832_000699 [Thelocarpon impressellum]